MEKEKERGEKERDEREREREREREMERERERRRSTKSRDCPSGTHARNTSISCGIKLSSYRNGVVAHKTTTSTAAVITTTTKKQACPEVGDGWSTTRVGSVEFRHLIHLNEGVLSLGLTAIM